VSNLGYTPIPNWILDQWSFRLQPAALRVLLYVYRRTRGFGKEADRLSVGQLCAGIIKRDQTRLDGGTGLSTVFHKYTNVYLT
jgi:hypothetical protein